MWRSEVAAYPSRANSTSAALTIRSRVSSDIILYSNERFKHTFESE
jgi:hypothetical protein